MKIVEQNECGSVIVREGSPVGVSRLWWQRFVEKARFEPGRRVLKV